VWLPAEEARWLGDGRSRRERRLSETRRERAHCLQQLRAVEGKLSDVTGVPHVCRIVMQHVVQCRYRDQQIERRPQDEQTGRHGRYTVATTLRVVRRIDHNITAIS